MNIVPPSQPFTFPEGAVAGDQITKTIRIENATTPNVTETVTVTASLASESASVDVPVVFVAPRRPTVTVTDAPGASFTVDSVSEYSSGVFDVTITATKL